MKIAMRLLGLLCWGAALAGCAGPALVGTWQLHEAQRTTVVTIQGFGHGRYYLHGHTELDGIYRRRDRRLVCVKPNDPRLQGFIWRIVSNNKLILVTQPKLWVAKNRYLGDTLTR